MKKLTIICVILAAAVICYEYFVNDKNPTIKDYPKPAAVPGTIKVGDMTYAKGYERSDSTELYAVYYLDNVRSYPEGVVNDSHLVKAIRKDVCRQMEGQGFQVLYERDARRIRLLWEPSCIKTSQWKAKKKVRELIKTINDNEN